MKKMVQDIIIAPVITEASMDMMNEKKYVFKVMTSATKPEIANAVEVMFGVKVDKVNTINVKRKAKNSMVLESALSVTIAFFHAAV